MLATTTALELVIALADSYDFEHHHLRTEELCFGIFERSTDLEEEAWEEFFNGLDFKTPREVFWIFRCSTAVWALLLKNEFTPSKVLEFLVAGFDRGGYEFPAKVGELIPVARKKLEAYRRGVWAERHRHQITNEFSRVGDEILALLEQPRTTGTDERILTALEQDVRKTVGPGWGPIASRQTATRRNRKRRLLVEISDFFRRYPTSDS